VGCGKNSEIPRSLLKRSVNPAFGAAGIGILAFHLLDPVPLSAGREFDKIVARFYSDLQQLICLIPKKLKSKK
jgi:hypothetical protein